ncbi:MAG: NAD(P)-dependent oxidoreductase [Bryobacteraceae bacterium]
MSKPRLLIIGANGFLGQHLAAQAAPCYEVWRADISPPSGERTLALDVTSAASVNDVFERSDPNVTVLLAAISDIDQCEKSPELARAVNVTGASNVVEECARTGAKLVFTSSAAVFDGTRHGYQESDPPTPVSVYGTTKALAEEMISWKLPSALIIRLALVIGFAQGSTNAMLNRFAAKLQAGESVLLPDFEYRNPIDAYTLSCFVLELLSADGGAGIFHVGGSDPISRFELGVRLADQLNLPLDLVRRQTEPQPGRAPRGLDHFLLTGKLQSVCRTPVPTSDEIIERAIHGSPQSN